MLRKTILVSLDYDGRASLWMRCGGAAVQRLSHSASAMLIISTVNPTTIQTTLPLKCGVFGSDINRFVVSAIRIFGQSLSMCQTGRPMPSWATLFSPVGGVWSIEALSNTHLLDGRFRGVPKALPFYIFHAHRCRYVDGDVHSVSTQ